MTGFTLFFYWLHQLQGLLIDGVIIYVGWHACMHVVELCMHVSLRVAIIIVDDGFFYLIFFIQQIDPGATPRKSFDVR